MLGGATQRTALSGLGTIIIIRWYIMRPYPEQRHHNAGAHRSSDRFTIASTCLKKKKTTTQARLDLCLHGWSWNAGERYCTITVMTYRGLTAGTLSFMLPHKSGSLGGRMSRGCVRAGKTFPSCSRSPGGRRHVTGSPHRPPSTFLFFYFFNFGNKSEPGAPDGMFAKSLGFISRIHLVRSPLKVFVEGRQNLEGD